MGKGVRKPAAVSIRREDYVGRGQTYVKHLFLREYLIELAFKVLQAPNAKPDFLYVDGFSGPWRNNVEKLTDTSFHVALSVLTEVASNLAARGMKLRMRAVFVEKDRNSFPIMAEAVKKFGLVETTVIPGEFEDAIPQIVGMVDGAFTFSFVDPTGWKGLALDRLAPLLRLRGEVLVNMMANSVTRHLRTRHKTAASFPGF
jgi:three-Cys-motif partner protein